MPKYEEIFQDFKLELPLLTQIMLPGAQWIVYPFTALLAVAFLVLIARAVGTIIAPSWSVVNPVRSLTDRIGWRVPPLRLVVRSRALADACHAAADALETGRPLVWAIDEAARAQTNSVLAGQLGAWAERIRNGEHPPDAARAAGLPDLLVGMLRTTGGAETAEVLRFLARYYDSRFSRGAVLLRAALVPFIAIATGTPVCLFILSVQLPLIRLIDRVNELVWAF